MNLATGQCYRCLNRQNVEDLLYAAGKIICKSCAGTLLEPVISSNVLPLFTPSIELKGVTWKPQEATLQYENRLEHLTFTEHKLLACLVRHKPGIVTNESLIIACWDSSTEKTNLRKYIQRLRVKLPVGAILNLRSIGYRLII